MLGQDGQQQGMGGIHPMSPTQGGVGMTGGAQGGGMKPQPGQSQTPQVGGMTSSPEEPDPIMQTSPFDQPHWQPSPSSQGHNGAQGPLASGSSTFPRQSGTPTMHTNMNNSIVGQAGGASKTIR